MTNLPIRKYLIYLVQKTKLHVSHTIKKQVWGLTFDTFNLVIAPIA